MDSKSVHFPDDAVNEQPASEYVTACRRQYLETTMRDLSDATLRTWLALCFHGRRQKNGFTECWPGMPALCRVTGLHRVSISRAIRQLVKIGWLRAWRRRNSNHYRLNDQAPDLSRAFRVYLFEP